MKTQQHVANELASVLRSIYRATANESLGSRRRRVEETASLGKSEFALRGYHHALIVPEFLETIQDAVHGAGLERNGSNDAVR